MNWILQGNILNRIEIFKSLSKKESKKALAKCISTFKRQVRIELLKELTIKQTIERTAVLEIS